MPLQAARSLHQDAYHALPHTSKVKSRTQWAEVGSQGVGPGTRGGGAAHVRADGSLGPPPLPCPLLVPAEGPSPVTCEFRNCLLWAICPPPAPQV